MHFFYKKQKKFLSFLANESSFYIEYLLFFHYYRLSRGGRRSCILFRKQKTLNPGLYTGCTVVPARSGFGNTLPGATVALRCSSRVIHVKHPRTEVRYAYVYVTGYARNSKRVTTCTATHRPPTDHPPTTHHRSTTFLAHPPTTGWWVVRRWLRDDTGRREGRPSLCVPVYPPINHYRRSG